MVLEALFFALLVPAKRDESDKRYSLLHEQAEKVKWSVVRCSIRGVKTLFMTQSVYKVTVGETVYLITIDDGNKHLYPLLCAGYTATAKALLAETKIK